MNASPTSTHPLLTSVCLALALVAFGCDSGTDEGAGSNVCDPGITQECVCPGGNGAQSCNDDGSGWGDCTCLDGNIGGTGTPDPTPDAVVSTHNPDTTTTPPDAGPECTLYAEMACEDDLLVWLDSCGVFHENVQDCKTVGYCSDGECVEACTPHAEKRCKGNHVFWFDSCAAEEGQAEECDPTEFCDGCQADDDTCSKEGQCVKAVLTGTWSVTASPDSKDACGMGPASFLPIMMDLQVDGTDVLGHAAVLDFDIDYVGTLDGKHLVMTGMYTETQTVIGQTITIDHTEQYDVYFTDLNTFSGNNADSFEFPMIGACTLYWNVTGLKQ